MELNFKIIILFIVTCTSIIAQTTPIVRVTFFYTQSALDEASPLSTDRKEKIINMKNIAELCIVQANDNFNNSSINLQFDLSGILFTEQQEKTSPDVIFKEFYTDQYVSKIKNIYKSDLCFLITSSKILDRLAGRAKTIDCSADDAFAMGQHGQIISNLTFTHECGHLFGARHNLVKDSSIEPAPYCHGYTDIANNFRTIMSYQTSPSTIRINHFSNPNIFINGNVTGTTTDENNARVLNDKAEEFEEFNTTKSNIVIDNSIDDRLTKMKYDSDAVIIPAKNTITLKPGTTIGRGKNITFTIEN